MTMRAVNDFGRHIADYCDTGTLLVLLTVFLVAVFTEIINRYQLRYLNFEIP